MIRRAAAPIASEARRFAQRRHRRRYLSGTRSRGSRGAAGVSIPSVKRADSLSSSRRRQPSAGARIKTMERWRGRLVETAARECRTRQKYRAPRSCDAHRTQLDQKPSALRSKRAAHWRAAASAGDATGANYLSVRKKIMKFYYELGNKRRLFVVVHIGQQGRAQFKM